MTEVNSTEELRQIRPLYEALHRRFGGSDLVDWWRVTGVLEADKKEPDWCIYECIYLWIIYGADGHEIP